MKILKFGHWFRGQGARWQVALAAGILFVVSQLAIYLIIRDISPEKLLLLQTSFSRKFFLETIAAWKLAGLLPLFKLHFIPDYLHPVWYSVLLASLMGLALNANRLSPRFDSLLLIPFVAGLLDLLENTMQLIMLADIGKITDGQVVAAALFANLKWLLAGISILLILGLAVAGKIRGGHD